MTVQNLFFFFHFCNFNFPVEQREREGLPLGVVPGVDAGPVRGGVHRHHPQIHARRPGGPTSIFRHLRLRFRAVSPRRDSDALVQRQSTIGTDEGLG
jgi:hypothetical protein